MLPFFFLAVWLNLGYMIFEAQTQYQTESQHNCMCQCHVWCPGVQH